MSSWGYGARTTAPEPDTQYAAIDDAGLVPSLGSVRSLPDKPAGRSAGITFLCHKTTAATFMLPGYNMIILCSAGIALLATMQSGQQVWAHSLNVY